MQYLWLGSYFLKLRIIWTHIGEVAFSENKKIDAQARSALDVTVIAQSSEDCQTENHSVHD